MTTKKYHAQSVSMSIKKDFCRSSDIKMDVSTSFSKLLFFILLSIIVFVDADDVCVKRSACSCVFPNGTGIDLSPSAKNSVYTSVNTYEDKANGTQLDLSTYFFHPCYDVTLTADLVKPTPNNTCVSYLSICRHVVSWIDVNKTSNFAKNGEAYNFLGSANVSEFAPNGSYIKYLNLPSYTYVYLVCAETDDEFYVKDLSEPNDVKLTFFSRNACLRQIDSNRSVGSTLLIIFFCFVIFYLVLGVGTKKFLMGATGVEVIPNLMFWSELPSLVKDGWAFLISGFRLPSRGPGPATSPDPNSYDSI